VHQRPIDESVEVGIDLLHLQVHIRSFAELLASAVKRYDVVLDTLRINALSLTS
jgi:hypothetical protein